MTGPAVRSFLEKTTADVQYAIDKCVSLGSGKQLIPSRESIGNCKGFFPHVPVFRRLSLPNMHFPVLYVASRHPW